MRLMHAQNRAVWFDDRCRLDMLDFVFYGEAMLFAAMPPLCCQSDAMAVL